MLLVLTLVASDPGIDAPKNKSFAPDTKVATMAGDEGKTLKTHVKRV